MLENPGNPIASAQNERLKAARRLRLKKHRRREGILLVEGRRLVESVLKNGIRFRTLFISETFLEKPGSGSLLKLAAQVSTFLTTEAALKSLSDTQSPQGIIGVVEFPESSLEEVLAAKRYFILADGIADPGNLGTIIRSAAGLGAAGVLVSSGCTDPFGPKAVRASMGAVFSIPVVETGPAGPLCEELLTRGVRLLAGDPRGGLLPDQVDFSGSTAIVIGAEAGGLSALVRDKAELVSVPVAQGVESLNAAAAAAILLYEAFKREGSLSPRDSAIPRA